MKQDIIEKYWLEFIHFYRNLMDEAVTAVGGQPNLSDIISDSTKRHRVNAYIEFKEPNETTFWKWYAINKLKENKWT